MHIPSFREEGGEQGGGVGMKEEKILRAVKKKGGWPHVIRKASQLGLARRKGTAPTRRKLI